MPHLIILYIVIAALVAFVLFLCLILYGQQREIRAHRDYRDTVQELCEEATGDSSVHVCIMSLMHTNGRLQAKTAKYRAALEHAMIALGEVKNIYGLEDNFRNATSANAALEHGAEAMQEPNVQSPKA